ncbi:MAG TPA: alanine dehydrogenase [Thermoanaerobaculia bacterium]|nr:alanine dehydrogenase [Thermoanaerobaculia bacterium]
MRIGVPREIKDQEFRVGLHPAAVHVLREAGHDVVVECGAGVGSGITDRDYSEAGARLTGEARAIYGESELVVKVKEPLPSEYDLLRPGQIVFTFLHLAPLPGLTDVLLEKHITGIAYETIEDRNGRLPLLTPMSEIAGRMAVMVGSFYLQRNFGGRGALLSGVPGVPPGDVAIVGGGVVGWNAAKVAVGLGARVAVLDTNLDRLRMFDDLFHGEVTTLASNHHNLVAAMRRADIVIGAVLIPGGSAPKLITRQMLKGMKDRSVIVDVAVDQGGCVETSRPTTHSDPVFEVEGVIHYCVANMPGAVPRTATFALDNATLPYILTLANRGLAGAVAADLGFAKGVNTYAGALTCRPVAESQGKPYRELGELLFTSSR